MDMLDTTLSTLEALVAIPSTPGNANAKIVDCILERVAPNAPRVRRVRSPLGDADGLILSVGPDVPGGIILSGHLDVVPVEGQTWVGDPFRLRQEGGLLYGRGTCDMKGFVSCAMTSLALAASRGAVCPLHVVLSADEESTCRSIESLVKAAQAYLPPVRGVIVGEPTQMRPANRHKASATHIVNVEGFSIHASIATQGADPIAVAAQLITWLAGETSRSAARCEPRGFDPDHGLHTATLVSGGSMVNSVAEKCRFHWDMRLMPDEEMAEITRRFDAFAKQVQVKTQVSRHCSAYFPGLASRPDCTFGKAVLEASGATDFDAAPFGTEAGFFHQAGFPSYVCGPGHVFYAHRDDEHIALADLSACLSFISKISAA